MRSRKSKRIILIAAIALALVSAAVVLCVTLLRKTEPGTDAGSDAPPRGNGLFSWHDEVFDASERETLFALMKERGLTELYQDVPHDTPVPEIKEFAASCAENGVRLYLLIGDPQWALDPNATELRSEIQRAALMGFAGVMVDVEPGPTDEWKEDRESVMEMMTEAFVRGKSAAAENGVEMIVCLSYYYDDYGFEEQIETIVKDGCDSLAIMNYNREDEAEQIGTEAWYCEAFGKALVNIYELKEPGQYDLEEIHTYSEVGLEELENSWASLRETYPDLEFYMALHDYRALKDLSPATAD